MRARGAVQAAGEPIERNPTQPPRNEGPREKQCGVTSRPVTPGKKMVELRGLEPLTPRLPELAKDDKSSIDKKRRSARRGKT